MDAVGLIRRAVGTDDGFVVRDARKRRFGVVFMDHIDTDAFRKLTARTRLVYFALLPFVGSESQQAWPKVNKLAGIVGCAPRTVYRALVGLEGAGYIQIGKLEFNKARRVNLYTLLEPPE